MSDNFLEFHEVLELKENINYVDVYYAIMKGFCNHLVEYQGASGEISRIFEIKPDTNEKMFELDGKIQTLFCYEGTNVQIEKSRVSIFSDEYAEVMSTLR